MRRVLLAALFALLALAVWWWPNSDPVGIARATTARPPEPPPAPTPVRKRPFAATEENSRAALRTREGAFIPPDIAELAHQLHAPGATAEQDLEILHWLVAFYRQGNDGVNPGGGLNVEIVAAMRGKNESRLAVLPADLPAFNDAGELTDRWNTPYYFHPISRTVLEIRSAGPDGRLWSDDDIELGAAPPEAAQGLTGS